MTIKIRQTPVSRLYGGPYHVFPDLVRTHLTVIAMAGSEDMPGTLGEDSDPADSDLTVVSYDPGPQDTTTPQGRVRQLLKNLVDRAGDITLFGVGPDFVWSDGSTLETGSAGGSYSGEVIYDTHNCGGDGRWVRGTDGNEVCTTSAGILLHELGHIANPPADPYDVIGAERAAVGVENDLRVAQGLVPRDPDRLESGCGCPDGDCCIVASVATGSPYSAEVQALRRIRDRALRNTQFGHCLFEVLHEEYYSFSLPISRMMVTDSVLKTEVANWLVRPLVRAWTIAWEYTQHCGEPRALGQLLAQDDREEFAVEAELGLAWEVAGRLLRQAAAGDTCPAGLSQVDAGLRRAYEILAERLPDCPHVRWGIIDLLHLYTQARALYQETHDEETAGRWLMNALDGWTGDIPLDYVVARVPVDDLLTDLRTLASTLFARSPARLRLGRRLARHQVLENDAYAIRRLGEGGYLQ
jgi:hypothetical protein